MSSRTHEGELSWLGRTLTVTRLRRGLLPPPGHESRVTSTRGRALSSCSMQGGGGGRVPGPPVTVGHPSLGQPGRPGLAPLCASCWGRGPGCPDGTQY